MLIVGDAFASGLGDQVSLGRAPGLATAIGSHLLSSQRIRTTWQIETVAEKENTSKTTYIHRNQVFAMCIGR